MIRSVLVLFCILCVSASSAFSQAPDPPKTVGVDPLALTRDEIKDLRIADLELKQAQMEQALLQARFRELGQQIEQMKQSTAALEAKIIADRKLPASSRINMEVKRVLPPPPKPPADEPRRK